MAYWLGLPAFSDVTQVQSLVSELKSSKPLQYPCLENPMDGRAWWATVHGVAKSQTQLSELISLHFTSCMLLLTQSVISDSL